MRTRSNYTQKATTCTPLITLFFSAQKIPTSNRSGTAEAGNAHR